VRESKNSICRFFYQMFAGYHDIAYILIIACRGSVSGQIEYLLNDVAWHRRVFELSDAPSAADYIAIHIRLEVLSIHPDDLFHFETVMAYGATRAYGNAMTASIA
jgi:hypothetical protein